MNFQVIERFAWFHRQVRRGPFPNADGLPRRIEISAKTTPRAVHFFRDRHHAPLEYVPTQRGYRRTGDSFSSPALPAGAEEIPAVLMARRLLSDAAGRVISEATHRFGQKLSTCHFP